MFGFENVFRKKAEIEKPAPAGEDLVRAIELAGADLTSPEDIGMFRYACAASSEFLEKKRGQ